jgi:hypothetical protein
MIFSAAIFEAETEQSTFLFLEGCFFGILPSGWVEFEAIDITNTLFIMGIIIIITSTICVIIHL